MIVFFRLIARTSSQFASAIGSVGASIYLFLWDVSLTTCNLFLHNRPLGKLIPKGNPGFEGKWPEYIAPGESDSRSCCPALNALANHGILPHNGRDITYAQMAETVRKVYNFSPSFCYYVPHYTATMLSRDYDRDTFDLSDINVHNGIEHDASLTRHDVAFQTDQGVPAQDLIDALLDCATGKDKNGEPLLTPADLSRYSTIRRKDSRERNGQFTLSNFHKVFGSSNSSTLLTILGGRVNDLRPFLKEERIPDMWESRVRKPWGLTMMTFNGTVLGVEMGIDEPKYVAKVRGGES